MPTLSVRGERLPSPRTDSQAALINREGLVYVRGHLKLTKLHQRFLDCTVVCNFGHISAGDVLVVKIINRPRLGKNSWGLIPKLHVTWAAVFFLSCIAKAFSERSGNVFYIMMAQVLGHLLKQVRQDRGSLHEIWFSLITCAFHILHSWMLIYVISRPIAFWCTM